MTAHLSDAEARLQERRRKQARPTVEPVDPTAAMVARLRAGAALLRTLDPTTDRWTAAMALFVDLEKTLRTVLDFTGCCCEGRVEGWQVVCDACVVAQGVLPDDPPAWPGEES